MRNGCHFISLHAISCRWTRLLTSFAIASARLLIASSHSPFAEIGMKRIFSESSAGHGNQSTKAASVCVIQSAANYTTRHGKALYCDLVKQWSVAASHRSVAGGFDLFAVFRFHLQFTGFIECFPRNTTMQWSEPAWQFIPTGFNSVEYVLLEMNCWN